MVRLRSFSALRMTILPDRDPILFLCCELCEPEFGQLGEFYCCGGASFWMIADSCLFEVEEEDMHGLKVWFRESLLTDQTFSQLD